MAYPTRGAWLFRNVDRAFDFWPTLESISITQEYPDMTAALSCRVVDQDQGYLFVAEDEVRVTFAGERIWAGHLKTVTEDRDEETGPRAWALEGQDYTAKLGDAIVRRRKKRKKEKALRRVKWLLRQMERHGIWTLVGRDLSHIPDEFIEAYDYFGASVEEGLAHVADELRMHHFIDLDNVFQMYRQDTVAAPFALDNDAPDYALSFPFREYSRAEDTVDLANAILVEPEKRKHSRWSRDTTSIAAYGRQERFISDSNLHRPQQALNVGARTLADSKDPEVEGSLVCWEPGIWGGMTAHVTEALWDRDENVFVTNVDIAAVDPHDEEGGAYLKSTLTFSDKRRRRRRSGHHDRGRDRSINKNTRRRPGSTADVDPYPIDTFQRTVAPPTWEASGDPMVIGDAQAAVYRVDAHGVDQGFTFGIPPAGRVGSYVGEWYLPHTDPDNPCAGVLNHFAGWHDQEVWWPITIGAHPADAAGILVTVSAYANVPGNGGTNGGVARDAGFDLVTQMAQPTETWQGVPVGHVVGTDVDTTLLVPLGNVPAAGGTLWLGLRAGWRCEYGATQCGWVWPYASGFGNSGRGTAHTPAATWAVYTDAGGDMGSIAVFPSDAPWDGGNAWRPAGIEGSPVFGVDGSAYYVTAEAPSGRGIYVVGEREDEDEPRGPWSDTSWAVEVTFSVDALGDTGADGQRSIEIITTGEGERVVGTVHLGDSVRAPGVSVGGPSTTDYAAKSLTDTDHWRALFDSRSGKMRGKVWKVTAGEPAAWDVEVPMSETEDDGDRVSLWIRCGNGEGESQTVKVYRIRALDDARDGKRVVREWLGYASGVTNEFKTNHPFRAGTLRAFVNGIGVPPSWEDGDATSFRLDFHPTAHSAIRATYIADQSTPPEPSAVTVSGVTVAAASTMATIDWTLTDPASGQVEYGPTSALGSQTTPEPRLLAQHSQIITGLTAATEYHYKVVSTDANGATATATGTFTTASAPVDGAIYGPAIAADGKGNLIMRPDADGECGYLFRTLFGGTVVAVRFECTNRQPPYYGGGDAGIYEVGFQSVVDGLPTGTWLGDTAVWDPVVTPGNFAVRVPITGGPTLADDTLYALIIRNAHASPNANWSSMNNPWNRYSAAQPMLPDNAVLKGGPSAWEAITYYLPAFDVEYSSGDHEGMAAITAQDADTPSSYIGHVTSTAMAAWAFTLPADAPDRTADAVQFFMRKHSGSTNATVAVKKNGTTVATGTFTTSGVMAAGSHSWQRAALSVPVAFGAGDVMRVEVSVTSGEYSLPTVLWRDSYPASGIDCLASWPFSENAGANIHRAETGAGAAAYPAWATFTSYQCYLELT